MKRRTVVLVVFLMWWVDSSMVLAQKPTQQDSVVVVFGDTRTNHDVHRLVVKDIMKFHPVAVFHTGDLVFNGKKSSDWTLFHEIMKPIIDSSRFYPCFGNHERHSKQMSVSYSVPNNGKWYSVNRMQMHFVVLDNYSNFSPGSEQYNWLVSDLEACSKQLFKLVVMHLPVYTSGPHKTMMKKIKKYLVPLFEKYGVSVVFSGHVHCYEKAFANNIYYITTGGGGAPLYPKVNSVPQSQLYIRTYNFCTLQIKNNALQIQALDTSMRVIDEVIIKK
ncbi:MAG: metallophosphoesterase [Bacteroidota bacterium]